MCSEPTVGRRRFIAGAAAAALCAIAAPAIAAPRPLPRRVIAFDHLHTGERLSLVYWAQGRYVPGALARVNYLLRDFRTGDVHPIDPRLLDLLAAVSARLDTREPYEIVSGYRSPATNEWLREHTEGVASNSLHMQGLAVDVRIPGRSLSALHRTALALKGGGVGYYPRSDFVHVDVGPPRRW
jgi:uncharacterized protein YcbK (DUF882 family)